MTTDAAQHRMHFSLVAAHRRVGGPLCADVFIKLGPARTARGRGIGRRAAADGFEPGDAPEFEDH